MVRAGAALIAALVALIVSLLLVGVVSNTMLWHVIQVAPPTAVLGLALARTPWVRFAAAAVFLVWLLIMSLIWLYLLGIARVVTGHFTSTEVVLTVVIGVACAAGLVAGSRARDPSGWPVRFAAFLAAAAVQVAAVWLSVQPGFANR